MSGGSPRLPALHVVVFSNFEGFCHDAGEARACVDAFREIQAAFPEVVWTHMWNPMHLIGPEGHREAGREHDAYLGGSPRRASVLGEMSSSLGHVRRIARRGEVAVRFVTASEVSALVRANPGAW